ncbi:uncharacterized protein TNCV_2522581 [Trichonephila clavipes]|nr:uncharacterized protein TNCV_2522581 [Trichonephila clavipes]
MDKRISDLIKLAKLNKDVKLKNTEQEWQKAGIEYTLQKFHKPVTERIEKTELTRKKELKAISDQLNDLSLLEDRTSTPLALEQIESKRYTIDPDIDLDMEFLSKNNLPLPSELFNKSDEIEKILHIISEKSRKLGNLKSQITRGAKVEKSPDIINYELKMLRLYKAKIKALNVSKIYKITGTGLISNLEILTNKLLKKKSKKVYNEIVSILDILLKDGDLTNDEVTAYYEKFLL